MGETSNVIVCIFISFVLNLRAASDVKRLFYSLYNRMWSTAESVFSPIIPCPRP